jgi:hypothetical protein
MISKGVSNQHIVKDSIRSIQIADSWLIHGRFGYVLYIRQLRRNTLWIGYRLLRGQSLMRCWAGSRG